MWAGVGRGECGEWRAASRDCVTQATRAHVLSMTGGHTQCNWLLCVVQAARGLWRDGGGWVEGWEKGTLLGGRRGLNSALCVVAMSVGDDLNVTRTHSSSGIEGSYLVGGGAVRCGVAQRGVARFGGVQFGMVQCGVVWCGAECGLAYS